MPLIQRYHQIKLIEEFTWVDCDNTVKQGFSYDGSTFTSNELANIHMDWQKEFQFNQANYLDMGIFMQQTFYKIYSQMHIR